MPPIHAPTRAEEPGHSDLRKAGRDAHPAHPQPEPAFVRDGPFRDASGEMRGPLVRLATGDRTAADPYARAGRFEDARIEAWNRGRGA